MCECVSVCVYVCFTTPLFPLCTPGSTASPHLNTITPPPSHTTTTSTPPASGVIPAPPPPWGINNGVIMNRQHNGLGNQIFQYIFSRLVAEDLNRTWITDVIKPALNETPRASKSLPPNTMVGTCAHVLVFSVVVMCVVVAVRGYSSCPVLIVCVCVRMSQQ